MLDFIWNSPKIFIIAEAGVNHNGDLSLAKKLVDGACQAGADAVKFQLFNPRKLTSRIAPLAAYQATDSNAASQQELLQALTLPLEAYRELQAYAQTHGILFLCTPFDEESALFLHQQLQLPCLKISSGELTNLPFLEMLGGLNTPLILSTGMATLQEVEKAIQVVWKHNKSPLGLLHCVSSYPAPVEAVNLLAVRTLRQAFPDCTVGYSDHTLGTHIPVAAVALGARIIEKHFTLDKTLPGPDHQASLTVDELTTMVREIRDVERALGDGVKQPQPCEVDCIQVARKSLVAARDLPAGHVLTCADIEIKRPGTGIAPEFLDRLVGRTLKTPVQQDSLFPHTLIEAVTAAHP